MIGKFVLAVIFGIILASTLPSSFALTQTFFDEPSFLSQSGATEVVTFPTMRGLVGIPYVENGITVEQASSFNNRIDDFTALLPNNEFVVSGPDHIDITFPNDILAFGLRMQDAFDITWVGPSPGIGGVSSVCPKSDSSFTMTFKKGGTEIDSILFDPPIDEFFFVGVITSEPFDIIEIREVGAEIGVLEASHCEDDFWGDMFASTDIPEKLIGGTLIPIDSTSLLLAGTQMTASWMIPVLVAGTGIVLILVEKRVQNKTKLCTESL